MVYQSSLPASRTAAWPTVASTLAMLTVVAASVLGVYELFRSDLPYPIRAIRLLAILLAVVSLALVILATERWKKRELMARLMTAKLRLRTVEEASHYKEAMFAELQGLARVGIWQWDPKSRTAAWSEELFRIHGLDPKSPPPSYEELPNLYTAESWQQLHKVMSSSTGIGSVSDGPISNIDLELIRPDGSRRWVNTHVYGSPDSSGEVVSIHGITQDITESRRMLEQLRESEAEVAAIANSAKDAIVVTDRERQILRLVANTVPVMIWMSETDKMCSYVNKTWLDFTGRPLEAELGNGWWEIIHTEDLSECLRMYSETFERREFFTTQYRSRRHDGEYRWIMNTGVPRFNPDGFFAGYIGSCIDVTERKLADEALATVGRRLIEAHEEERKWIARELHDDINQRLALLAVELDRWNQNAPLNDEFSQQVRHAHTRITEIAEDLQGLSHRLHSSKLEYLGLATAAKSLCKEVSEENMVEVSFKHSSIPRTLPSDISLCLFRVLQEALQNAVKHSGVRSFVVELHGTSKEIEMVVTDTGRGFEVQETLSQKGLGLISMRERLQLVHGEFSIRSMAGTGTTISARVPLRPEEPLTIAS